MQDIFSQIRRIGDSVNARGSAEEWDRQYARFRRASDIASRYMRNITSTPSYRRTYFSRGRDFMDRADNIKYARSTYMGNSNG